MVYGILIYVQLPQEAKMIPKTTRFFSHYVVTLKNANIHKVISNIYMHHLINYENHNESMFRCLLKAFNPFKFCDKLRILHQIERMTCFAVGFTLSPIAYTES